MSQEHVCDYCRGAIHPSMGFVWIAGRAYHTSCGTRMQIDKELEENTTIRDEFAMRAMQALMLVPGNDALPARVIAELAYEQADAMRQIRGQKV